MTKLESDVQRLYEKNILVQKHSLPANKKAMSVVLLKNNKIDETLPKAIFYDDSKLQTVESIRVELLHEETHIDNPNTMYKLDDCYYERKSKEYKTDYLVIKKYIPENLLFNKIFIEKKQLFEIAEDLCLTEELISKAYNLYSEFEGWIIKKNKILL